MENFFAQVGRPLQNRQEAPVPPSHEDIAKLIETAPKYGVEILAPH